MATAQVEGKVEEVVAEVAVDGVVAKVAVDVEVAEVGYLFLHLVRQQHDPKASEQVKLTMSRKTCRKTCRKTSYSWLQPTPERHVAQMAAHMAAQMAAEQGDFVDGTGNSKMQCPPKKTAVKLARN